MGGLPWSQGESAEADFDQVFLPIMLPRTSVRGAQRHQRSERGSGAGGRDTVPTAHVERGGKLVGFVVVGFLLHVSTCTCGRYSLPSSRSRGFSSRARRARAVNSGSSASRDTRAGCARRPPCSSTP